MAGVTMDGNGERSERGWLDPSRQEVVLRVLNTDMRGWILTVPSGTSMIGREPDCQIHLPHYTISRRHCSLQIMPDSIEVRDLNSMNGTMVNGSLTVESSVRPGDKLRVGEVELAVSVRDRVVGQGQPAAVRPPPPEGEAAGSSPPMPPPPSWVPPPPVFPGALTLPPVPPIVPSVASAATSVPAPAMPVPQPTAAPTPALQPSQYSYHLPTPSWAVRPHVETVRYREAKRTMRFDPARRDAFRQFRSG